MEVQGGGVNLRPPQKTRITATGAGTYNTPAGALYLEVKLKAAGSGGRGSGTSPGNSAAGGATTFGTLTANGGGAVTTLTGGVGGTATGGDLNRQGQNGGSAASGATNTPGGQGGGDFGAPNILQAAGVAAPANSGCGGSGAGTTSTASPGPGGAEGGYIEKLITSPSASYSYSVGAKSTGGTAGTGGFAGGDGADGYIEVIAYFQ